MVPLIFSIFKSGQLGSNHPDCLKSCLKYSDKIKTKKKPKLYK